MTSFYQILPVNCLLIHPSSNSWHTRPRTSLRSKAIPERQLMCATNVAVDNVLRPAACSACCVSVNRRGGCLCFGTMRTVLEWPSLSRESKTQENGDLNRTMLYIMMYLLACTVAKTIFSVQDVRVSSRAYLPRLALCSSPSLSVLRAGWAARCATPFIEPLNI